ncbi:hypothetical protein ACIPL1_17780 [Pseudomonas sp. NPDC090202]|uniref:hypothetical protein n=1 Tax=unclassified Pseudomonas TaxID=196821 RepID=UPI0038125B3C
MNKSLAALALGCALTCTSFAALAGSTSPDMGPPPSQTGNDPRVQGSDIERQGTEMDPAGGKAGIRSGMNTGSMSNGHNDDADLPGGDTSGGGTKSKGPSSSSSAGGVGG